MFRGGVDTAGRDKPKQMDRSVVRTCMLEGFLESRVGGEFARFDGKVDTGKTLVKNAAGANGEMTDFGISHLSPA